MSDAKAAETPAGKSKKSMMMGVGALVVVLAGGGYWFMGRASAAPKDKDKEHEVVAEESGEKALLPLEPFVVNLADESGTRFLRTSIQLIIDAKEEAIKELVEKKVDVMPLRSAILEILAQQKAATLVTPEGKEELKAAIMKRGAEVFKKHKIKEVLFAEFVVQF